MTSSFFLSIHEMERLDDPEAASNKRECETRVTGDEAQGTTGRRKKAGEATSLPLCPSRRLPSRERRLGTRPCRGRNSALLSTLNIWRSCVSKLIK